MAIHHITFCNAMDGTRPVVAAAPASVQTLTANGVSTITASQGQVCVIASDTACYVAFGTAPTAAANSGHFIPAGATRDFGFLQEGWKVAVTAA